MFVCESPDHIGMRLCMLAAAIQKRKVAKQKSDI